MADVTVAQFAEVLKVPVDRLLQQLDQAGIKVVGAEDMISEDAIENIFGEVLGARERQAPVAAGDGLQAFDQRGRNRTAPDDQLVDIVGAVIVLGRQSHQPPGRLEPGPVRCIAEIERVGVEARAAVADEMGD